MIHGAVRLDYVRSAGFSCEPVSTPVEDAPAKIDCKPESNTEATTDCPSQFVHQNERSDCRDTFKDKPVVTRTED